MVAGRFVAPEVGVWAIYAPGNSVKSYYLLNIRQKLVRPNANICTQAKAKQD